MVTLDQAAAALRADCAEDYVGIWEVSRHLRESGWKGSLMDDVVSVVGKLLEDPSIMIGQFHDNVFEAWPGSIEAQLGRVAAELQDLGRDPDIGEIAWLAQRIN